WAPGRGWPVIAGMVVLTSPLAPEVVAWCAGVFDATSTTFILAAVLIARRYDLRASAADRMLLAALSLGGLLSKETAAIGPVLIVIDAWVRGSISKRLARDLLIITAGIGLIATARFFSVITPAMPP